MHGIDWEVLVDMSRFNPEFKQNTRVWGSPLPAERLDLAVVGTLTAMNELCECATRTVQNNLSLRVHADFKLKRWYGEMNDVDYCTDPIEFCFNSANNYYVFQRYPFSMIDVIFKIIKFFANKN